MACDANEHKLHMCALKAQEKTDLIKSLSENATVECESCGARAKDPQNVCSPRQLPDIAWLGDGADQCKGC